MRRLSRWQRLCQGCKHAGDNRSPARLTTQDVLRRYKEEDLPAFCEISPEDVDQVGNFSERSIHVACVRGRLEEIAALVGGGADLDAAGDLGYRPLHEAVGQGHLEVVKFLVDHGASLSEKNDVGMTALDIARLKGRIDIAEFLNR
jgi:ankyrin repeat protein